MSRSIIEPHCLLTGFRCTDIGLRVSLSIKQLLIYSQSPTCNNGCCRYHLLLSCNTQLYVKGHVTCSVVGHEPMAVAFVHRASVSTITGCKEGNHWTFFTGAETKDFKHLLRSGSGSYKCASPVWWSFVSISRSTLSEVSLQKCIKPLINYKAPPRRFLRPARC